MLDCPNLEKCMLKINKEEYKARCMSGKHEDCIIYICNVLKLQRFPKQWRDE